MKLAPARNSTGGTCGQVVTGVLGGRGRRTVGLRQSRLRGGLWFARTQLVEPGGVSVSERRDSTATGCDSAASHPIEGGVGIPALERCVGLADPDIADVDHISPLHAAGRNVAMKSPNDLGPRLV